MGAVKSRGRRSDSEIGGFFSPLVRPELLEKRLASGKCIRSEAGIEKRCPKCNTYWPMDTEFFYPARSEADGLFDWCRACYIKHRWPEGRSEAPKGESHDFA